MEKGGERQEGELKVHKTVELQNLFYSLFFLHFLPFSGVAAMEGARPFTSLTRGEVIPKHHLTSYKTLSFLSSPAMAHYCPGKIKTVSSSRPLSSLRKQGSRTNTQTQRVCDSPVPSLQRIFHNKKSFCFNSFLDPRFRGDDIFGTFLSKDDTFPGSDFVSSLERKHCSC